MLSRKWGVPLVLEYNGSAVWIGRNWDRGFRYPAAALQDPPGASAHASPPHHKRAHLMRLTATVTATAAANG
jgi:hypothetical protein